MSKILTAFFDGIEENIQENIQQNIQEDGTTLKNNYQ